MNTVYVNVIVWCDIINGGCDVICIKMMSCILCLCYTYNGGYMIYNLGVNTSYMGRLRVRVGPEPWASVSLWVKQENWAEYSLRSLQCGHFFMFRSRGCAHKPSCPTHLRCVSWVMKSSLRCCKLKCHCDLWVL